MSQDAAKDWPAKSLATGKIVELEVLNDGASAVAPPFVNPGSNPVRIIKLPGNKYRLTSWFDAVPTKVKAAYLGVSGSRLTPVLRSQLSLPVGVGLVVNLVDGESPAAKAGLKQYDVLHKLNNQILVNLEQLAVLVRTFKPGNEVTLTVIRQAKPTQLKAKLIEKEVYDPDYAQLFETRDVTEWPAGKGKGMQLDSVQRAGIISASDGEQKLQITLEKNRTRLVVTDKNGKQVFQGWIDTEADVKALPEAIRKKLESLHTVITTPEGSFSIPLKGVISELCRFLKPLWKEFVDKQRTAD